MEVKRVEQKFILNRQESLLLKKRLEPIKGRGTISAGCRQREQWPFILKRACHVPAGSKIEKGAKAVRLDSFLAPQRGL